MAGHDRLEHHVFGKFLGFGFDHQHGIAGARRRRDRAPNSFSSSSVGLSFNCAIDIADARGADRAHEGNAGERQRRRGRDHRDNVGIVLEIMREHRHDDLRIVAIAVGEKRPDRAIDQAGDQRLLFRGTAFALEIAAGDAAGGEGLFLIIDGKGEEVDARLWRLGRDDGGENRGLAIGREHGAIGLARDASGFEHELAPGPIEFFTMNFKHLAWSFSCERQRPKAMCKTARGCRRASSAWRSCHGGWSSRVWRGGPCRRTAEQSAVALRNIKAFPQRARTLRPADRGRLAQRNRRTGPRTSTYCCSHIFQRPWPQWAAARRTFERSGEAARQS